VPDFPACASVHSPDIVGHREIEDAIDFKRRRLNYRTEAFLNPDAGQGTAIKLRPGVAYCLLNHGVLP